MAIDLAKLVVTMEANSARFIKEFERVDRRLDRWEKNAKKSFKNVEASFSQFQSAIAALGIGLLFREIVRASDSLTLISGRLRLVTKDTAELAQVQRRLFDVAQNTRASFETTAELYARVALNARNLGASQDQLLKIVEATNQAIVIGGASTAEAAGGVRQFTQAIASGELRGEELRSVMENMPRLAKAIADGLETDIGGLRRLSKEGELTAERVVSALLSQQDKIAAEFEKMPRTVGQAVQQLRNQMLLLAGAADMSGLVESIDGLRSVITDPATVEGLRAFASGVVGAFAGMAKFAAETARFTKFLAENVAAIVGGANDPARIDERLRNLRNELISDTVVDPLTAQTIRVTEERKAAIREEIKLLEARRGVLEEFGGFDGDTDANINIKITSTLDGIPNGFDRLEKKTEAALKSAIQSLETESETAARVFHERRALIFAKVKDEETRVILLDKLNRKWASDMEDAAERVAEAIDLPEEKASILADQAARNIQSFTASMVDAALAGENMGDAIVASLRRIAAELATAALLRGLGNLLVASGNPLAAGIGAILTGDVPGKARGGPVAAGRPFIVGERGEELFVPSVSGTIVPNGMFGGSVVIEQNIDARGADPASAANMVRALRASNDQLRASLFEELRRGTASV